MTHSYKSYNELTLDIFDLFHNRASQELISNISCGVDLHISSDMAVLVGVNTSTENSYVSSLFGAYVSYPIEELALIKDEYSRKTAYAVLKALGLVFKLIRIDSAVFVGNFFISTNFFPKKFGSTISQLLPSMVEKYSNSYICIRSLNSKKNIELISELNRAKWTMLPARIVYLFDYSDIENRKRKNHYKNDMKLLLKTNLTEKSSGFGPYDYEKMQKLYEALYIEKHSNQNPKFSAKFIELSHRCEFLEIYAFYEGNEMIAFIAMFQMDGVLSTPMLGYDTSMPQEFGLYRILCAKLHQLATQRGLDINFSSGAGEFKKLRGGVAALEYTAIYTKHLCWYKRAVISIFSFLANWQMESFFKKNELL